MSEIGISTSSSCCALILRLSDALMPPPQRATPARKSVRCGVGNGPPHPHPPRPWKKGSVSGGTPEGRAVGGGQLREHRHS